MINVRKEHSVFFTQDADQKSSASLNSTEGLYDTEAAPVAKGRTKLRR